MTLKATQQTALDNLVALLTEATTGLKRVHTDPPDALSELPALIIFDRGVTEVRHGQWRELRWDLGLTAFVQLGKLSDALQKVRDLRGDLIDRLGTDITLDGAVERTTWATAVQVTAAEWNRREYAACEGVYTLWIRESYAFA